MQQQSASPCNVRFLEWLDGLSDKEHHDVLLELRLATQELGCGVDRYPFTAKDLLNLPPHIPSALPLN